MKGLFNRAAKASRPHKRRSRSAKRANSASTALPVTARKPRGLRKIQRPAVPGISNNPATNLLLVDLAMRGASIFMRRGLQRGILGKSVSKGKAADIVAGRSMAQSLLAFAATRVATRSVPGLIIVGGGLLAKLAFERSQSKRKALREGERDLHEMAQNTPED